MTRRAIIGNIGGGVYGLKVSRPGYDVTTCDPDDPEQTSFYSEWTDVVKVLDGGYLINSSNLPSTKAVTDPGYIPWIECRKVDRGTNTVYDERTPFTWGTTGTTSLDGLGVTSERGLITLPGTPSGSPVTYEILYVVFNVPVGTQ
jgi:hypothetical protein